MSNANVDRLAAVNEVEQVLKQAEEARRMASKAANPSRAKACLQLAKEFEKLAERLQRLQVSSAGKGSRLRRGR